LTPRSNRNVPETEYDPMYGNDYAPNENGNGFNNNNNNNNGNNNNNLNRNQNLRPAPSVTSASPRSSSPNSNSSSEAEDAALEAFSIGNDTAPNGTFESFTPSDDGSTNDNAQTLPGTLPGADGAQTLPGNIDDGSGTQTLPGNIDDASGTQTLPGNIDDPENNLEENEDYLPSQDKNLLQPLRGIWPFQDKNSLQSLPNQDKNSLQTLPGNLPESDGTQTAPGNDGTQTLPGDLSGNDGIQTLPGDLSETEDVETPDSGETPSPSLSPFRRFFNNTDDADTGDTDTGDTNTDETTPRTRTFQDEAPNPIPLDNSAPNDYPNTTGSERDNSRSFSRPIIDDDDEPREINLDAAREYIFFNNWMSEEDYFSDPYVTRSQAIKAVVKMANIDETSIDEYADSFRDTKSHSDRSFIEAAKARDIIAVEGDYLNPDENVKKAEFISMLENAFNLPEISNFNFSRVNDVYKSDDEISYSTINNFYYNGVIKLDENNNFHPNELLTKEEFAQIIYNMKDYPTKSFEGYGLSSAVILDRIFSKAR
jgi:hypothetical protein